MFMQYIDGLSCISCMAAAAPFPRLKYAVWPQLIMADWAAETDALERGPYISAAQQTFHTF